MTVALVELAKADPQRGFAAIYDEYGACLYAYCHRMLRSSADAADAVQECFVTALAKIDQLRDPAKLRSWLYAIARNHCMRLFRNRSREHVDDAFAEELAAPEFDDAPASRELVELVWAASDGLSQTDRQIIELNIRHELDGEELAQTLGVEPAKCYVMLHRAKERLQGSVSALLVARTGTANCSELATVVGADDAPSFTPLIRKRVNRHVKGCAVCEETQRRHRPEAYLAVVPLLRPPASLEDQVARAVGEAARMSTGAGAAIGATGATGVGTASAGPAVARSHGDWGWRPDGFPTTPVRVGRRTGVLVGTAAMLLLIAGMAVLGLNRLGSGETVVTVADVPPTEVAVIGPVFEPTSEDVEGQDPLDIVTSTPEPATPTPTSTPVEPTTTATPLAETEPLPPAPIPDPPTPTPTPTAEPTPTPTPTAEPTPTPTPTAEPTPTPTSTPTPTATEIPDVTPPTVTDAVADCSGDPYTVSVTVADDVTRGPSVSLSMTFNDRSATPRPLLVISAASSTWRASVTHAEAPAGVTFYVDGFVMDDAGNVQLVTDTAFCSIID